MRFAGRQDTVWGAQVDQIEVHTSYVGTVHNSLTFPRCSRTPNCRAEFLALILVSLMVLHKAEGVEMENTMKEVAKRTQATGDDQLSAQVCDSPRGQS